MTPWVTRLTVRNQPSRAGAAVGKVSPGDRLVATGERGSVIERILLRGGLYETPYVEVVMDGGAKGYVYAGGLHELDTPSPAPVPQQPGRLEYDRFGSYDLTAWQETERTTTSEGDADIGKVHYRAGQRILEDEHYTTGEYGFGNRQRLTTVDGELLRERSFSWTTSDGEHRISEEITRYDTEPPRSYRREQLAAEHFSQLSELPTRVVGEWREQELPRLSPQATALPAVDTLNR